MYPSRATVNSPLNYCIIVHVYTQDLDKKNKIEIAREFIGNDQTRLHMADLEYYY